MSGVGRFGTQLQDCQTPEMPEVYAYLDMPSLAELEAEERQMKSLRRKDKKFNRFVAVILIFALVGAPLLGLGMGLGASLADSYFLPRLLNDSAQRQNFAFDNVHNIKDSTDKRNP